MKYIKSLLIFVLILPSLSCCQKPTAPMPELTLAEQYYGKWFLYQIETSEIRMDVNGDGKESENMLDEYSSMIGYWEPNLVATVEPALSIGEDDLPALSFNVLLPYPGICKTETDVLVAGVRYLPISIRVDEEDLTGLDGHSPDVLYPEYSDPSEVFLSGIDEIEIIFPAGDDETFWIRMECRMVDSAGDFSNGTMDFKYRKVVVE